MFKNLLSNLSKRQKLFLLSSILVFIILLIVLLYITISNTPVIKINNLYNHTHFLSPKQEKVLGDYLWTAIKANSDNDTKPTDVVIRDESFSEIKTLGDTTLITFLVDIDSIKQTFKVVINSDDSKEADVNTIGVECPLYSELKYKDHACILADSSSLSIDGYLPYTEKIDDYYFTASKKYYLMTEEDEWYIEIKLSTCNNRSALFNKAKEMTIKYLTENKIKTEDLTFNLYTNYHECPNL